VSRVLYLEAARLTAREAGPVREGRPPGSLRQETPGLEAEPDGRT
jgi:hypothetical protein